VIRYYGGTNLGVGGLIAAYRTAAKAALENAQILVKEETESYEFSCTYAQMPGVMTFLKKEKVEIIATTMDLSCHFKLLLNKSAASELIGKLEALLA
jgi:putative IMPACT (imprinted ancient) family translation regulator